MPRIKVVIYREEDGDSPLLEWLDTLPAKAQDKFRVRIERLKELGHELRRPEADFLRDGVYELRARIGSVNYRILYFFYGKMCVVLSHGLTKNKSSRQKRSIGLWNERGNMNLIQSVIPGRRNESASEKKSND